MIRTFFSRFSAVLIVMSALPVSAFAEKGQVVGDKCVFAPYEQVLAGLVNYNYYSKLPGADYQMPLMGSLLSMVQSVGTHKGDPNDAMVQLGFAPMGRGEKDKDIYPRFVARCRMILDSKSTARHECATLTSDDFKAFTGAPLSDTLRKSLFFAIKDYTSSLTITDAGCTEARHSGHGVKVQYTIDLETDPADMKALTQRLGLPSLPLSEQTLFEGYFQNFYKGAKEYLEGQAGTPKTK